jgi:hypothetical protein
VLKSFPFRLRVLGIAAAVMLAAMLAKPALATEDVVHFGNTIDVGKDASVHDAVCFFCSVDVQGTVKGDIVVFFGSARIDGRANHDVVVFFGDVKAGDDSSIGQDLVNFFGGVRLGENVTVGKDTVVMFGDLRAANTASIGGDRVVQPGWIFWVPFLLIFGGISFVVHEFRIQRQRRMLRGY